MDAIYQDLRYALRLLLKNPGFSIVAVLTLALGIGATTAMFTVVNGVILSPFPFSQPDRLVVIKERVPKFSERPVSIPAPDVLTFAHESQTFSDVAGYQENTMDLTGIGDPRKLQVTRMGANALAVLGVTPLMGRNFTAEEDQENGPKVAILSYRFWRSAFAGDSNVIGKSITLDRTPHTIVGVMPESFIFPIETYKEDSVLWVPMAFTAEERKAVGDNFNYGAIARLKNGTSVDQARAEASRVMAIIRDGYPAESKGQYDTQPVVMTMRDSALGDYREPLLIMMVAVVLVLLIAIANVANLLLARGSGRQRELSIRVALGAGRARLFSQLISESVLLGTIGGAVGTLLAQLGVDALVSLVPANIPRIHAVQIDWRVLLFVVGVSILSGIVFGLAPAAFALRVNVNDGLKEGGRSGMQGRNHRYARTAFVVAQFSLAVVMLVGAGLLIRSFQHVLNVDPGFRVDHVISAATSLPRATYKEPAQRMAFYNELMLRLNHLPGATSAGASTDLPMEGNWNKIFSIAGQTERPGAQLDFANHSVVLSNYFQAMGIPLIRGRMFADSDNLKSQKVIIISKGLADRYFGTADPIGQRLKWGTQAAKDDWKTIIGVVGDVKQGSLDQDVAPHTYESYQQYDEGIGDLNLAVRTSAEPAAVLASVETTVHALDRELPVTQVRTMEQVVSESNASRRFYVILVFVFGVVAITLASVGLYGMVAFAVEQRTREIGIRVTLGATQWNVLEMILRWAVMLAVAGILLGAIGAFAATRVLTSFLFGVKADDPMTFMAVAVLLGIVALLASYIPARRATKVDPMVALRYE
ncbi:MAG TPA: ABC transporter permease [Terriglobales bacterium]|nr:ABC transporter permease [Terriglobales bacterium]